jgi:hypothetical protein
VCVIDLTLLVVNSLLFKPGSDTRACTTVKGKGIPIQGCTGPHGPRKLRFPEFLDIRHMKLRFIALRTS